MLPDELDEKKFRYTLPKDEWFLDKRHKMDEFIVKCSEKLGIEKNDIETNYMSLGNVFIRLDERMDYFLYFHSSKEPMHISCEKEVALVSYWIVKYKPFRLKTITAEEDFYEKYKCSVNDAFAALIVISYLCKIKPDLKDYFTPKKINTLIYDLINRDISKEAMIMYVESFV